MTTKVYLFLADGFETIEALAVVDILRRGGIEVKTVSIMGRELVESAQKVTVKADELFENVDLNDASLLLLPGGLPGANYLNEHEGLRQAILKHNEEGKKLGAICAAPMVFGSLNLLNNRKATCYPGFEKHLTGAQYTGDFVTIDGNIITAKGAAASLEYAYCLLEWLTNAEKANEIKSGMLYDEQ